MAPARPANFEEEVPTVPNGRRCGDPGVRAAQTACASILWTTAHYGFPVSTTHTISGSVLGAGASSRLSAVRWGVAGNIVVAWVLTIPCAALVGAGMETLTRVPGGAVLVFLLTAAIACTAFLGRSIQARRLRIRPAEA